MVTLLVVALVLGFAAAGYARGATQVVGLLVGTVIAILVAPHVGPGLEGLIGSITGTGGLLARLLSIGLVGLALIVLTSVGLGYAGRVWAKQHPQFRPRDRQIGLGLGALEGALVALMILWVPLALEPVARATVAADQGAGRDTPDPAAARVLEWAGTVRGSAIGGVASATNPASGSELLELAGEFAAISRDEQAMDRFMATPAMRRIESMPSVQRAVDLLESDPELRRMYEGGVTVQGLFKILDNPTILKVLDTTTVIQDLTPMTGELKDAIRRTRQGQPPAQPTSP